MDFYKAILNYKDDILKSLDELMQIPSIASDGTDNAEKALDYILNLAKSMGFKTKKIGNIAGHVEYGKGEELSAVLTHVDVVPCGEGWNFPPYKLTRKDNMLYGRGIADDKGSAIVALYCLKVLKDNNIVGKRKLRVIFGCAEEVGMLDMKAYFKEEKVPDMAFTPDSDYGICNVEKGILQLVIKDTKHNNSVIKEFNSGSVINAVPDKAVVIINKLYYNVYCTECKNIVENIDNGIKVTFNGIASHACMLEKGINSATHLIKDISNNISESENQPILLFINDLINLELYGDKMGIKCSDDVSGSLTLNVGYVKINDKGGKLGIDIRYPVKYSGIEIFDKVKNNAEKYGLTAEIVSHLKPLYVDANKPIISILNKSYKNVMGVNAELYSTGGGTYARTLCNNGVAFGPVFKDEDSRMHNSNECLNEEKFFLHAQICCEAMKNIMCD